ncbi:MAG: adenosylmethionine decarboxylase [Acidovorax sp.]
MHGLHLTADLYHCACAAALMSDTGAIAALCRAQTQACGLAVVGEHWHRFAEGGGVTGALLLAESHVALHTWPELGSATLDVYVCNYSGDNSAKARALMDALVAAYAPRDAVRHELERGAP